MKRLIRIGCRAALGAMLLAVSVRPLWGASSLDATITVTPVADVTVSLDVNSYNFGPIDVNTSTRTATAIRLTNAGDVSIAVDKQITAQSSPAGWTADVSSGTDRYVLYCATSAVRPSFTDFTSATRFGLQGAVTSLTGSAGTQPILPPAGGGTTSVDLWFRLDMPTQVSSLTGRSITVRFTGTAQ